MFEPVILVTALINGLMFGAIYALVALGLTLIYGVLHIINFAHGALLMLAMYAVYFLFNLLGIDPYLALLLVIPSFFVLGYLLYRGIIGKLAHGQDHNILLITLGLRVIFENSAFYFRCIVYEPVCVKKKKNSSFFFLVLPGQYPPAP